MESTKPKRKTREDWLMAGLTILGNDGHNALTLERLLATMGVTKGSFYHHFADLAAYKAALIAFCLEQSTLDIIDELAANFPTPSQRLAALIPMLEVANPLEIGLRTWARADADAAAVLQQIDTRRMDYVTDLAVQMGLDESRARQASQMIYMIYIGSQYTAPPLIGDNLAPLYQTILQMFDPLEP